MIEKVKALLNSVRLWTVVGSSAAGFFAEISTVGYSNAVLFKWIGICLASIVAIGTLDKSTENLGGK